MQLPSLQEIQLLAVQGPGPHVSILLPVETAGRETRQNTVRLKNLLRAAEEDLAATGMRPTKAHDLLAPGWDIEDDTDESPFWQERAPGLALYFAEGFFRHFWLPHAPEEVAITSERFYVKPFVELAVEDQGYYLLAVSMNDVRFFRGSRFGIRELLVEDMPRNMAEAMWPEDPQKQHQFHTVPAGEASGKGGSWGVFHGTGAASENETKDRLLRYFQQIDRALQKLLNKSRLPLVIASVDYLRPIYAQANTYSHLLDEGIAGNPEELRHDELRDAAWALVEPHLADQRRELLARFRDRTGTGLALSDIQQITAAAGQGRVDTLLYAAASHVWGVPLRNGEIGLSGQKRPGDEDIIDFLILKTLEMGGEVHAFEQEELGSDSPVLAILRY